MLLSAAKRTVSVPASARRVLLSAAKRTIQVSSFPRRCASHPLSSTLRFGRGFELLATVRFAFAQQHPTFRKGRASADDRVNGVCRGSFRSPQTGVVHDSEHERCRVLLSAAKRTIQVSSFSPRCASRRSAAPYVRQGFELPPRCASHPLSSTLRSGKGSSFRRGALRFAQRHPASRKGGQGAFIRPCGG